MRGATKANCEKWLSCCQFGSKCFKTPQICKNTEGGIKSDLTTFFKAIVSIYSIYTSARDGNTQQDIKGVFSPIEIDCLEQLNTKIEGKTEKQKNPHHKNTLAFAAWVIARLGGWSGYIKQRPSGLITMRDGLIQFYNLIQGFELNWQK